MMVFSIIGTVYAAEEGSVTWEVSVGKETAASSMDSMFPKVLFIHEGDKVVFKNEATFTPHTVTFLAGEAPLDPNNPASMAPSAESGSEWDGNSFLNSGIMHPTTPAGPATPYEIIFTTAGAYNYYCVLHPMMTGTIVVLPDDAKIPTKIEQMAEAKKQLDALIERENQLLSNSSQANYNVNADGSLTYLVDMGSADAELSFNRNMPETIVISEGDSVQWTNQSGYEPHFVTFNKPDDLNFFMPDMSFNPQFLAPAGSSVFSTTEFTNSGILLPKSSYSLEFNDIGKFYYECYLHSGSKMSGYVIVVPKGSAKVVVNGEGIAFDGKQPYMKNGHIVGAIVPFVEALGGTAQWVDNLRAVHIHTSGNVDHHQPAQLQNTTGTPLIINGTQMVYHYEPAPHVVNGRSYASLQDLTRAIGGTYTWDEGAQTLYIQTKSEANAEAGHNHH